MEQEKSKKKLDYKEESKNKFRTRKEESLQGEVNKEQD